VRTSLKSRFLLLLCKYVYQLWCVEPDELFGKGPKRVFVVAPFFLVSTILASVTLPITFVSQLLRDGRAVMTDD
jgi:hypothetical protein